MAYPPFKCTKAIFINSADKVSQSYSDVMSSFNDKKFDIYLKDNELFIDLEEYIHKIGAPFCSSKNIKGMNTDYLLDHLRDDDVLVMICYNKTISVPFSVLLFKYDENEKRFYIVSVCADLSRHNVTKGSGGLLIDELIEVATMSDVNSIYLHSVESAIEKYEKKGFNKTGNFSDKMPEMTMELVPSDVVNDVEDDTGAIASDTGSEVDMDELFNARKEVNDIELWNKRDSRLRPLTGLSLQERLQRRYPAYSVKLGGKNSLKKEMRRRLTRRNRKLTKRNRKLTKRNRKLTKRNRK